MNREEEPTPSARIGGLAQEMMEQVEREIREEERPPMIGIPAYQEKFGRRP